MKESESEIKSWSKTPGSSPKDDNEILNTAQSTVRNKTHIYICVSYMGQEDGAYRGEESS